MAPKPRQRGGRGEGAADGKRDGKAAGARSDPSSTLRRAVLAVAFGVVAMAAAAIVLLRMRGVGGAGAGGADDAASSGSGVAALQGSSWETAGLSAGSSLGKDVDQMSLPGAEVEGRVLSIEPRVYIYDDLLSAEECEYLIKLAEGRLQPAGVVVEAEDKYAVQQKMRDSEQMWMTPREERELPILRHVLKRMHRVAHVPSTDAEGLQIGRYTSGQKYETHVDTDPTHDVMRPATMLLYLSDVEEGGATLFPLEKRGSCDARWHKSPSGEAVFGCAVCCHGDAPGIVRVRPKRGRAVLFFNHNPAGAIDQLTAHAACPVIKGVKWIAQRWFRTAPYQNINYDPDPRFDGLPSGQPIVQPGSAWNGNVRELMQRDPRVYAMDNFISAEEADHLLKLSKTFRPRSLERDLVSQWQIPLEVEVGDAILSRVAKRLHRAAHMPESHGQPLVLERISPKAASGAFARRAAIDDRIVAVALVFISDGEAAGSDLLFPLGQPQCKLPECCRSAAQRDAPGVAPLRVPARQYRAVLVYPDGPAVENALCAPPRAEAVWTLTRGFRKSPASRAQHRLDKHYDITPGPRSGIVA